MDHVPEVVAVGFTDFLYVILAVAAIAYLFQKQRFGSQVASSLQQSTQLPAKLDVDPAAVLFDNGCACKGPTPVIEEDSGCCGGQDTSSGSCCQSSPSSVLNQLPSPPIKIIYATQTNTAKAFASQLSAYFEANSLPHTVAHISTYDFEDTYLETSPLVLILASYSEGASTDDAEDFSRCILDARHDVRVSKNILAKLPFAVFGLGDSAYPDHYCTFPILVDQYLGELGAQRLVKVSLGDRNDEMEKSFDSWKASLKTALVALSSGANGSFQKAVIDSGYPSDDEYSESEDMSDQEDLDIGGAAGSGDDMVDLEDLGAMAGKITSARNARIQEDEDAEIIAAGAKRLVGGDMPVAEAKEMVTPMIRASLEKQGYKIVGSHSGVKICRWTKSALRGRGGCYKHAFYNIASHRCMETTPSLACANKCVFCWRSHTNPVGTEWRWKMDEAEKILEGVMEGHRKMINVLKGMQGVIPERFQEAMTIQHCALSLVGEPIMYPEINHFVNLLHKNNISSFLVTNAQFPEAIENLEPVTQLYVSIDASTKDSLKKIDRPLFRDFWERFLSSLDAIKLKQQRTVYRLTLVKGFNTAELKDYADLVKRGEPDFIEVKGVTYCGFSEASNLTMKNVPYHQEVVEFVRTFNELIGGDYELACEHEHSCSILLAHRKFYINDQWHTWIDYNKFHVLYKRFKETGETFTSLDYAVPTADWAVFGHTQRGFNPVETRFRRKTKVERLAAKAELAANLE